MIWMLVGAGFAIGMVVGFIAGMAAGGGFS